MTDLTKFGQSIQLGNNSEPDKANGMVQKFSSLKATYKDVISSVTILKNDPDGQRFFCEADRVYVFPRHSLETLLNTLNSNDSNDENDCVLFFSGCRKDETVPDPQPIGRSTLVAIAYQYNAKNDSLERLSINSKTDGLEHPGGLPPNTIPPNPTSIPSTIQAANFDWAAKRIINL